MGKLRFAVAASVVVALVVRALHYAALRATPELLYPVLDGAAHREWALGLLAGSWPGDEPFFRAPAYVYFLAAAIRLVGDDAGRLVLLQLALGAITPALIARLAARLHGVGGAWVAGIGAALYPAFPFFEGQLLVPVLAIPVFTGFALAALRTLERPGIRPAIVAGLLGGVATIARPPLLLAGVLLPLALVLRPSGRRRWASAAVALAALLLPALLVTARNATTGDPVFLASQGGLNFYLGNGRAADGMAAVFPDRPDALGYDMLPAATRLAEEREGRGLRPSEVSAHFTRRTLAEIRDDPIRWLDLLARKARLFWLDREIPNNHDPVLFDELAPWRRALPGWGFWAPLGLVGLALARRRPDARFLGFLVLAVWLSCVLFFVNARFRLPAVPFLLALGSGAVLAAYDAARARRGRVLAGIVGAAVALGLLVRWNPDRVPRDAYVMAYVLVAGAAENRGDPAGALPWIERALDRSPALGSARLARVELLWKLGRTAEAREAVETYLADDPDDPGLRTKRAMLLDLGGDREGALREVEEVLRIDPVHVPAILLRAITLHRAGRWEEARRGLEEFLRTEPPASERRRVLGLLESLRRTEGRGG
jgi:tetratricopeptide (TPR) repeat protein